MEALNKIQFITDEDGNKKSVVIPVEAYEEILEDIQDLVAIAERSGEDSVPLEDLIKSLKSDGLL
ncbi:hypothetical protein MRY87_13130 [bacterium]|nr:hypothetical protein [bacterium]